MPVLTARPIDLDDLLGRMRAVRRVPLPRQLEGKQHPFSGGVSSFAVIDLGPARLLHLHGNRRRPALLDAAGGVLPQHSAGTRGSARLQCHRQRSVAAERAFNVTFLQRSVAAERAFNGTWSVAAERADFNWICAFYPRCKG